MPVQREILIEQQGNGRWQILGRRDWQEWWEGLVSMGLQVEDRAALRKLKLGQGHVLRWADAVWRVTAVLNLGPTGQPVQPVEFSFHYEHEAQSAQCMVRLATHPEQPDIVVAGLRSDLAIPRLNAVGVTEKLVSELARQYGWHPSHMRVLWQEAGQYRELTFTWVGGEETGGVWQAVAGSVKAHRIAAQAWSTLLGEGVSLAETTSAAADE